MENPTCKKHGVPMAIKWYAEGTPFQDFDGYYCPQCKYEMEHTCNHPVQVPKDKLIEADAERLKSYLGGITLGWHDLHYWSCERVDKKVGYQLQNNADLQKMVYSN